MNMKIGQVAEESGVNLQTIRYYERDGLLPAPPRLASGYRLYTEDTVRRVKFIKRAQELGFTLDEIGELLTLRVSEARSSAEVRSIAEAKITDIENKVRALQAMKKALVHLTDKCSGNGPATECPILESLDSDEVLR